MFSKIITSITLLSLILLSLILLPLSVTKEAPKMYEIGVESQIELPDNFDKVYKSFKSYNEDVDTSTAIIFCDVVTLYNLNEDEAEFEWLMAQILLESGAVQYTTDRNGNTKVLTSPTGAVGFGQILRSTSILYLQNEITLRDSLIFGMVGVTDYSFVNDDSCTKMEKWRMARNWLSNERNNIALWGKIMSGELKRRSLMKALVSYNVGPGGMREYIDSGNSLVMHPYIKGIRARLRYVK
jgi:hypothetical protein